MSPVVTTVDETLQVRKEIEALERAWHGPDNTSAKQISKVNKAQLTVTRNSGGDFQDRQVYLYVDGEEWGKVKYGRPVTSDITARFNNWSAFTSPSSYRPWT